MEHRVLVADDHEIVRRGLCALLRKSGWEICCEATDGQEAVERARELQPDLAILDIAMPRVNGLEATRLIRNTAPHTPVLVLTMYDSEQMVRSVLNAGARGFLLKTDAAQELVTAADALRNGKTYFTSKLAVTMLQDFVAGRRSRKQHVSRNLTGREVEIVQLIADGKTTKDIAGLLRLGAKTVETHRANIMRKLGLHSTGELVLYDLRNEIYRAA